VDEEAQLRADIEKTRAGMSDTIDALQEKLAPERIMEQVKEKVQEQAAEAIGAAKHAVREATIGKAEKFMDNVSETVGYATRRAGINVEDWSILRTIRDNPLPFALIGAGLGLLFRNKRNASTNYRAYDRDRYDSDRYDRGYRGFRQGSYDYRDDREYRGGRDYQGGYRAAAYADDRSDYGREYERGDRSTYDQGQSDKPGYLDTAKNAVSEVADRTKEAVSSATGTIRETAANVADKTREVADKTREQVEHFSQQAEYGARRAGDTFETWLRDYPLAVGVAALAAGVAVGMTMPATRVEREYMGEARDQFMEKAQTVAKDTVDKVQHIAQEVGRTVQEEAQHQGVTQSS
jgi:ElaB/YqjD/DUF883 family membrane-anchored ribosome-binding protein